MNKMARLLKLLYCRLCKISKAGCNKLAVNTNCLFSTTKFVPLLPENLFNL